MRTLALVITAAGLVAALSLASCGHSQPANVYGDAPAGADASGDADANGVLSDEKDITSFSFLAADNPGIAIDATATITGTHIEVIARFATGVTALEATFSTSGKSVTVSGSAQVSGVTANDFTNPVTYTVTAADGTTKDYTVAVTTAADFPTGSDPISVAIGDINGDGRPDLVVANFIASTVSVLLDTTAAGATAPSFAAKVDFPTGADPSFVAIGDVNGDGRPDLVVANMGSNTVSVMLNTTAAGATTPSFAAKVDFPTGTEPAFVAIGDLDGDGSPDLAVANRVSNTVSVLLDTTATGATTPSFAAKVDFTTGPESAASESESVAIGDVNGDGQPDLAVANGGSSSNTVSVLLNTTAGATIPSFAAKVDFTTGTDSRSVAIGDLNGDGRPDLAVANYGSNTVSVLLNTAAMGATIPSFAAKVDFATADPESVAIGDLDGDGTLDLAVANVAANTVSVLLNTTATGATTPSFAATVDFSTGTGPYSVATGDFNGDGQPDLATADCFANTVSVLLAPPHLIASRTPATHRGSEP